MKRNKYAIILLLCVSVGVLIACKKNPSSQISGSSDIFEDLKYRKSQDPTRIEDLYILPSTLDYLLQERPEILEKVQDQKNIIKDFEERVGISIDGKMKEYFDSKKNYDKSSIFSDIP